MYLVDTNVLSAGAPGRRERQAALVEWMDVHSRDLFLSAITIAEISDGIANLKRIGSAAKAARLDDWLELVLHLYGERVLPFDVSAARLAGELPDAARGGSPSAAPGLNSSWIAVPKPFAGAASRSTASDRTRLLFHRSSMPSCLLAKSGLRVVVEVADARHGRSRHSLENPICTI